MKLGISTLACNGWTLEKSLEVCRQNGIGALEVRMGLHPWSQLDLAEEEYRRIDRAIEEAGVVVSDLGTSVVVRDDDPTALEELERCAQIAGFWHCRGLRIMLGNFYARRSEPRKPVNRDGILSWLKKADKIMEAYGTEVWIETHNEFATGRALRELLDDAGTAHVRLLWDIMHPLEAGESLEESYALMKPDLVHVHIKDGTPWPDPDMENYRYTPIGQGSVDIAAAVKLLRDGGYDGWYSLEWEGVWRKEIQGPEYPPEGAVADFVRLMHTLENRERV